MAKKRGKTQARKGKNQTDLKPISAAIVKCQNELRAIKEKKVDGPTRKQKAEIAIKLIKLELLRKFAEHECCDSSHFCPCPDPYPNS